MKTLIPSLALAGLSVLAAGAASAGVTVTFSHPENYADMPYASWDREQVLKDLDEYFVKLGQRLPAGQELQVEVLDLSLAGRIHPNIRGQNVRILRGGADWPHMHLRYTLEADGKVLSSGDENLSNMDYLDHIYRGTSNDSLRYEKRMIEEWFKKKFIPGKAG